MKKCAALAVAASLALAGCTSGATVGPATDQGNGWTVVGKGSVQTTCDHGNRLYYAKDGPGVGLTVVAADPTCVP